MTLALASSLMSSYSAPQSVSGVRNLAECSLYIYAIKHDGVRFLSDLSPQRRALLFVSMILFGSALRFRAGSDGTSPAGMGAATFVAASPPQASATGRR